jgi:MtaA/CmuA family methyltransferase
MPVYLEAVRLLRESAGDEVAVRACGTGAFSLAGHMIGPENFVTELAMLAVEADVRRERRLRTLMDVCTETTIAFAQAALDAGADIVMCGDSLASLDMISPEIYRAWAHPYESRFFASVRGTAHDRGAAALLHVCGDTRPVLPEMIATGADILELDWKVPLAFARERIDASSEPRPAIMGNLDPSAVLLQGTREEVLVAARTAMSDAGPRFLLGSGCEVAPATPPANMEALLEAATASGSAEHSL